ncbi:MAG TPA: cytochrome c biogenesis protein CcdA [Clostridiales bacterium]|nr:cytochrome c biogenesis protein CcdA [Clostridiales bacterium]HQP69545.1 cytochrome c biogenesis protein CcdA [Clostridiales bacterium]
MKKLFIYVLVLSSLIFSQVKDFDPEKNVSVDHWLDRPNIKQGENFKLLISVGVPDGFHITEGEYFYFDTTKFPDLKPEGKNLSGKSSHKNEPVYKGTVSYVFEGQLKDSLEKSITVAYQICSETDDESCFMPVERELNIDFSKADPEKFIIENMPVVKEKTKSDPDEKSVGDVFDAFSENESDKTIEEKLAAILEGSETWTLLVFLIAFLGGILDSMTPCVYPVIPVVISYMGAKSEKKKSAGFFLSLFFVIGLAVTYSIVGLLASFLGGIFGVGDIAANPYVRIVIALIFTILALSMFGVWEMSIISSDQQTKWMKKGKESKGILGAMIIGMVSGVVAAPCVGPVLAVLLIHVATAGDILYGWMLFIAFAFGLGLLFIVLGTFSGAINALPHAGSWMVKIKKFFGVVMIGAALFFISIVIPEQILFGLIALLSILLSLYIGAFSPLNKDDANFFSYLGKTIGLFIFAVGIIFALKTVAHYTDLPFAGSAVSQIEISKDHVAFEVTDSDTLLIEKAIASLENSGKLVMVDMWAKWCMNCIELDKVTWNNPGVIEFSKENLIPIKLDFTDKDSEFSKKYIAQYKDYGATNIPLILFINGEGKVVEKIQGLVEGERMLKKMKNIVSQIKQE